MGKTRRKLYGKSRRRKGGVHLGKVACAAAIAAGLAALPTAYAQDPTWREQVGDWWENGGIERANALGIRMSRVIEESFSWPTIVETTPCGVSPETRAPEDEAKIAPYLDKVSLSGLKHKGKYKVVKDDDEIEFEYDTWKNSRDGKGVTVSTYDQGNIDVPFDAKFTVVSLPTPPQYNDQEDEDDEYDGGKKKRKSRRKTLRRKK